eukprot:TRINITY_DN5672_c0_g1_i3.p1 TRINITY_DN5672_c0_g1~~TRINITY_DN5672_c0_g1_i3.p1  ORF type:complete len:149 (-),score=14.55 TRINITY_DN5672_c0_g1_i3:49-495(-)
MYEHVAKLLSVAWLTVPIGMFTSMATCMIILWWRDLNVSEPFAQAVLLHGIACFLEILAEPLYILSQNLLLLRLRVKIEAIATVIRCLTTYIMIVFGIRKEKAMVFAFSQIAFACCSVLCYWGFFLGIAPFKWLSNETVIRVHPFPFG